MTNENRNDVNERLIGSEYHDFMLLLERMGFRENKVSLSDDLGDYEYMCQIDNKDGGLLVSLMTNMGDTMFRFDPLNGRHVAFFEGTLNRRQ